MKPRTWLATAFLLVCSLLPARAQAPEDAILGLGVDGVEDWSRLYLFADAMKQSRGWGSPRTPWDLTAAVDADGWPTGDAGVVVLAAGVNIGGTYRLSFLNRATVAPLDASATVQNYAYNAATNLSTADVVVSSTAQGIMLSFTGTTGGVRKVRLMRPGYTNETFTRDALDLLRPYSTLRFMTYAYTNGRWTPATGNMVREWRDRTRPNHATQNRMFNGVVAGASWEHAIQLANLLDKDIWVNVPDLASEDYMRQLATLLLGSLEADRKIYVEWSNEAWNGNYAQTPRNQNDAIAEVAAGTSQLNYDGSTNQGYWAWRRFGQKTVQVSNAFRSVFGDAAMMTRVRPILCSQFAQPESIRQPLEFIASVYGPPNLYLYAIAGAPYFGLRPNDSARTDLTEDIIFSLLPATVEQNRLWTITWTTWARYYGLRHFTYEGGPHLVGSASLQAKLDANRDERMGTLIEQHLRNFYEGGGDQFEFFTAASAYSQYGMFGIVDDVSQRDTVKTRALGRVLAAGRPAVTAGFAVPSTMDAGAATVRDWTGYVASDPAGGTFLGSNRAGSWANYLIRVAEEGDFAITARVGAAGTTGQIEILVDAGAVATVAVPRTGGMTVWQDLSIGTVHLTPGLHVVRARFAAVGFSLKSITLAR